MFTDVVQFLSWTVVVRAEEKELREVTVAGKGRRGGEREGQERNEMLPSNEYL